FDVTALTLGINGVERERGFARAGEPGHHHQLVARDLDVDVLEVVLARASNPYADDLLHGVPTRGQHTRRGRSSYHRHHPFSIRAARRSAAVKLSLRALPLPEISKATP